MRNTPYTVGRQTKKQIWKTMLTYVFLGHTLIFWYALKCSLIIEVTIPKKRSISNVIRTHTLAWICICQPSITSCTPSGHTVYAVSTFRAPFHASFCHCYQPTLQALCMPCRRRRSTSPVKLASPIIGCFFKEVRDVLSFVLRGSLTKCDIP